MGVKIFMAACFVPVVFLMFGILYFEGNRKGNILLGVTLWPGADEEAKVQEIRRSYRRRMWFWLWVCLGLFAASCFVRLSSVALSLQMLWLLLVMVIFFVPHVWGNRRLKEIKREWMALHGVPREAEDRRREEAEDRTLEEAEGRRSEEAWDRRREAAEDRRREETELQTEAAGQRHVDVTAISRTPPRPFWKGGFAGALLGFVPVIGELFFVRDSFFGWWTELMLLSLASGGLALLWVMWHFWRMRTDVVSWRSEVNQQVARVRQYQWGRFWCLAVWEGTIFSFVLWYGLHRPRQMFVIVVAGTLVMSALLLVQMVFTEKNVRKVYEAYADSTYWDDAEDDHWLGGILYYNKKDSRFMVNKRVGVGTTVNMAKTSGKVFMGAACGVTAVLLLGAAIWLPAYDFIPISLKVDQGQVVSRQFGEEYRIPMEEIETVELIQELPSLSKRVGTAMETIYKGSFMDKEYHSCKVCVRLQEPPFVKIVTKEGLIYYLNDEEVEGTRAVYEEIINGQQ